MKEKSGGISKKIKEDSAVRLTKKIRNKLRKNYEDLAMLEAIDTFYQIKGLTTEVSTNNSTMPRRHF